MPATSNLTPFHEALSYKSHPRLEWVPTGVTAADIVSHLSEYSSTIGWRACCHVSDEDVPSVIAELERFDFNDMEEEPPYFAKFLAWLHKMVRSPVISMCTSVNLE